MTRYYFNIQDGDSVVDEEGVELADMKAIKTKRFTPLLTCSKECAVLEVLGR